jgi:hypothetical protein
MEEQSYTQQHTAVMAVIEILSADLFVSCPPHLIARFTLLFPSSVFGVFVQESDFLGTLPLVWLLLHDISQQPTIITHSLYFSGIFLPPVCSRASSKRSKNIFLYSSFLIF